MDDRGQCFKFSSPCFSFLSGPIPNFIIPSWFFFFFPPASYVYSFYSLTLWKSPSLCSYSSTIHLLEPFSLTTIKRLDFKSKSRESRALPSEWHRIKLLGASEPQMGWIPQDVSSALFLSFMWCLSELRTLVKWMGGVRHPYLWPCGYW